MTGQGDDNTTCYLLFYLYFNEQYKMIAIDFSKQDVDPKSMQWINFTANVDLAGNRITFFIVEKAKETILDF